MTIGETAAVRCAAAHLAISSRLDGVSDPDDASLDEHLASCAACRAYEADAVRLRRSSIGSAPAAIDVRADLATRVLKSLEPDRSTSPTTTLVRAALAVTGMLQFLLAMPALVYGRDTGIPVHYARHFGAFNAAFAVGLCYTALRPRRTGALLPAAAVLTAAFAVTAAVDVTAGRIPLSGEEGHLVEAGGLVLLWVLTRLERPRPPVRPPLRAQRTRQDRSGGV